MNYFNTLPLRLQLEELGHCRFMDASEFSRGVEALKGKKIVFVGCGAQGLHQGLNLRDSGLDVSYTLRPEAIQEKRASWKNATENGFKVGTYEEMIPDADLVCNLTPDKQHHNVIPQIMPLMKKGAALSYSHGFNIVEEGQEIRQGQLIADVDLKAITDAGRKTDMIVVFTNPDAVESLEIHPGAVKANQVSGTLRGR